MADTTTLTDGGRVLLALSISVVVAAVANAARRPREEQLRRWADRYGLELTPDNRPALAAHLRRAALLRTVGAGAGWLLNQVWTAVLHRSFPLSQNALALALAGYLIGAVLAEVATARPVPAGARAASLVPRLLGDYLAPWALWALRLLPLATLALAPVRAGISGRPRYDSASAMTVVVVAVGLAVFAAAVEAVLRCIVARPQPAVGTDLVAVDDALRAGSISALTGAGIGVLLVGVGWAAAACSAATQAQAPSDLFLLGALAAFTVGLTACWSLTRRPGAPAHRRVTDLRPGRA